MKELLQRTEAALAWQAGLLRRLPVPLLVAGAMGELRQANDAALRLLHEIGLPDGALMVWQLAAHKADQSRLFEALRQATPAHEVVLEPLPLAGAGARVAGLRVAWVPPDPSGRSGPSGASGEALRLVIIDDRTAALRLAAEQAAAREEAARAAAAEAASAGKTEVLARLSQELRTPLNGILGFGQLLLADPGLAARAQEQVRHIVGAARQLTALVDQVLQLNRLTTGTAVLRPQPVLLAPIVQRALALAAPVADKRRVVLALAGTDAVAAACRAQADPEGVEQIVNHLVGNAIKFCDRGHRVEIAVQAGPERTLQVVVRDDGPGLDAEQLQRLFEPLDRLGREVSRIPGSGLGLSIAERLARAMGGRIDAKSMPGRGSEFVLALPRYDE